MREFDTLEHERDGGVAVVRLANPPVNAVNQRMVDELRECFDALADDRSLGAVVLSAAGERAYCGGIDLKERAAMANAPSISCPQLLDPGKRWRAAQHSIRHCPVPVIAAVDGVALGAGIGIVGVVDLIIASRRAAFGLPEINVGLLGGAAKTLRMVGPFKTKMMFFSGESVPAEEFYRLGAIEELVEPGEAERRAVEIGKVFAQKSPIALRLAKESILRIEDLPMEEAYRVEQDYNTRLGRFNDAAEAVAAYTAKREPKWTWS